MGIDPDKVPSSPNYKAWGPEPRSAVADYAELVRRFHFAVQAGKLPSNFTPTQALEYATANAYVPLPNYLTDWLAKSGTKPEAHKTKDANSTSETKQLNSALKIIAGLLQITYTKNLETKQRGKLISEILGDMECVGQNMDRETLKKYVDKALDQFASASTPPNSA
jgi:hypothetical protein